MREAEADRAGCVLDCPAYTFPCPTKATHLLVIDFTASSSESAAAPPPLCDCEEGPVTVHCNKCSQYYCDGCDAAVHARGGRKAHARTYHEHKCGGEGKVGGGETVKCPFHPGYPYAYFCTHSSCDHPICAVCAVEDHTGHHVIKLSEASGTSRQEIEVAEAAAMVALTKTNDGIVDVNKRRKEVELNTDAACVKAQQVLRAFQAKVLAHEKKVKAEAVAEDGRKEDVLVKQGDELETAKDRLETGLALTKQVLGNASDVKVLQFERTVVDGLNAATHHGVSLQPQCGASVLFVETAEMKALREMFPLLGYISGSDTNPSACTTEGDGLKEATVGKEAEFVVSAVDFQGKRRTTGGDGSIVATVTFDGQVVRIDTTVFDSGDGAYTLKYTFPEGSPEGACQLDVLILGQHVQESPFAVQVSTERGWQFVHASTQAPLILMECCAGLGLVVEQKLTRTRTRNQVVWWERCRQCIVDVRQACLSTLGKPVMVTLGVDTTAQATTPTLGCRLISEKGGSLHRTTTACVTGTMQTMCFGTGGLKVQMMTRIGQSSKHT